MLTEHGFHLAQWQSFEKRKGVSVPSLLRMCAVFNIRLEDLISGLGRVVPSEPSAGDVEAALAQDEPRRPRAKKRSVKKNAA